MDANCFQTPALLVHLDRVRANVEAMLRHVGGELVRRGFRGDDEHGERRRRGLGAGHSGMFPCLRAGVAIRLVRARARVRMRRRRVSRGAITSST